MNQLAAVSLPESFRARFTTAEFLRMGEAGAFEGMKVELVRGELERMNPPMGNHASRQAMVAGLLWPIARAAGFQLMGEVGIALGDDMVLACDAALLRIEGSEQRLVRPEEILLVIEIAETTRLRDLGMKRMAYAGADIPFYWVVDGQLGVTHTHSEPTLGDYRRIATIPFGEPVAVPGSDSAIVIA